MGAYMGRLELYAYLNFGFKLLYLIGGWGAAR